MANQSSMSHRNHYNHYNHYSFDQFNASLLNKFIIYKFIFTAYIIYKIEAETM